MGITKPKADAKPGPSIAGALGADGSAGGSEELPAGRDGGESLPSASRRTGATQPRAAALASADDR